MILPIPGIRQNKGGWFGEEMRTFQSHEVLKLSSRFDPRRCRLGIAAGREPAWRRRVGTKAERSAAPGGMGYGIGLELHRHVAVI
jgi:hypothetical protein